MTPTTCHATPFSVIASPTIDGRPPNRACQSSWLMMHTAGPFGRSSSAVKLRPSAGMMPSVGRNVESIRWPFNCSGSPLLVSEKLSNAEIPTEAKTRVPARISS